MGFEDPAKIVGSEEFIFSEFRRIRDQIEQKFKQFYIQNLKPQFDTSDSV
jgi:arsenate reductase